MKKNRPGRRTANESFKGYTTKEVLDYYEAMLTSADNEANRGEMHKEKKARRDAKVIENYLIKTHLKNATLANIQELYVNVDYKATENLLLKTLAKRAKREKDLIWAYNMNRDEHEEVDEIVKAKLKKMRADWFEITEEAIKGSRICHLCIQQMIAEAETLGDVIFALESNDRDIINNDTKTANKESLLAKLPTIEITEEDREEFGDEFTEENGKITLINW